MECSLLSDPARTHSTRALPKLRVHVVSDLKLIRIRYEEYRMYPMNDLRVEYHEAGRATSLGRAGIPCNRNGRENSTPGQRWETVHASKTVLGFLSACVLSCVAFARRVALPALQPHTSCNASR